MLSMSGNGVPPNSNIRVTSLASVRSGHQGLVPSGMWLELVWRALRSYEGIVSGGEVNRLIDWFGGERLPAVDLAHVDLTGCKQRPEQHGGGVC